MFNVNDFVKACQGKQPSAIKEILTEALRDPLSSGGLTEPAINNRIVVGISTSATGE